MRDLRQPCRALWQTLRHNWPWKLAALAVALIVFFGVRRSISYTQTLTLSVDAETAEGAQALTSLSPGVVRVTFRGSETAIRQLSMPGSAPPRVHLSLEQPPPGASTMKVRVSRGDVDCDDGLRVVALEPTELEATFDSREARVFAVDEPVVIGAPAYGLVQVTLVPKTVEVIGSGALLKEIDPAERLSTSLLDVSNRPASFQTTLRVMPPGNRGDWTLRPDTVRAEVRIVREDATRTFLDVPVRVMQSATGRRYRPDAATVEVTAWGASRELESIDPAGVVALVGERPGEEPCEPLIVLPCSNRVSRVEITPPRVRLLPETEKETP